MYYLRSGRLPTLSIAPTGQPQFQTERVGLGYLTTVYLPVAVTNHTGRNLLCWVGATSVESSSHHGPWFEGREVIKLGPRSGTITMAEYNSSAGSWLLVADYLSVQSPWEVKLRRLLHRVRVPNVATNDVWRSLVVGRIVQD
jgi:hypothetical protein